MNDNMNNTDNSSLPQYPSPLDYKDVEMLKKYISERGRIVPRRITGITAKRQRELSLAIKRARYVGLLPYTVY